MGSRKRNTMGLIGLGLVCAACTQNSSDRDDDALSLEVQGEDGLLTFEIESEEPLSEGAIDLTLSVRRGGQLVDQVTVAATVLMPAMPHGASSPEPEQVAPGRFLLQDVDLSMPGRYELEILATTDQIEDWASITLDVP